jgi:hypothetical protein
VAWGQGIGRRSRSFGSHLGEAKAAKQTIFEIRTHTHLMSMELLSGVISSNLFVLIRREPISSDDFCRMVIKQYIRLRSLIHT